MNAHFALVPGLFVDLVNDWRVLVVESDIRHAGVFYIGSYPYDAKGQPLHPQAPAIAETWNGNAPGARQISERQKRFDALTTPVHFEPIFQQHYA